LGCSKYPDCQTIINLTKEGKPAPEDRPYLEEDCPDCKKHHSLVMRYGRYGDYLACTTKDCKHTSPIQKKTGVHCSREGCVGEIVEKKSRFGKIFYGCNSWSKTKCDTVFWYTPINEHCPQCNKLMMYKTLKRGDKVACSDTKGCGYDRIASPQDIEKYRPKLEVAPDAEEKSVFSL
jgi:DNA topoisomerase-1